MNKTNIILSGEGGQGIQSIAKIFAKAAFNSGLEVAYLPYFGVEQRGTPSTAFITVSGAPIRNPQFDVADYAFVLQRRAIKFSSTKISPNTTVIFDSSTFASTDLPKTAVKVLGLPATKDAVQKFTPKSFNLIVLGVLARIFNISEDIVWPEVVNFLGKKFKTKDLEKISKDALAFGYELVLEKDNFTKPIYKIKHGSVLYKGYDKSGEIIPKRCKGCGICILKCPVGALSFSEDLGVFSTPIPKVDLEKCIGCGNCRSYCPDAAISVVKNK